jgi:hypothetical protein
MLSIGIALFSRICSPCVPYDLQILYALKHGYWGYACCIIERNPELLSNPAYGRSPLTHGVMYNLPDFVAWCIARNVLHTSDHRVGALTPLSAALFNDRLEYVRLLIAAGVAVNEQHIDGHYPLHYAALYCPSAVELLLAEGAWANPLTYQEDTPLGLLLSTSAKYHADGKKALEALLCARANPFVVVSSSNQPARSHLVDDLVFIPEAAQLLALFDLGCSVWYAIPQKTLKGRALTVLLAEGADPISLAKTLAERTGNDHYLQESLQSPSLHLFALKYLKKFAKPSALPSSQIQ